MKSSGQQSKMLLCTLLSFAVIYMRCSAEVDLSQREKEGSTGAGEYCAHDAANRDCSAPAAADGDAYTKPGRPDMPPAREEEFADKYDYSLRRLESMLEESRARVLERLETVMEKMVHSKDSLVKKLDSIMDTVSHSRLMMEVDHLLEEVSNSKIIEDMKSLPRELKESVVLGVRNRSYVAAGIMVAITTAVLMAGSLYYAWCHTDAPTDEAMISDSPAPRDGAANGSPATPADQGGASRATQENGVRNSSTLTNGAIAKGGESGEDGHGGTFRNGGPISNVKRRKVGSAAEEDGSSAVQQKITSVTGGGRNGASVHTVDNSCGDTDGGSSHHGKTVASEIEAFADREATKVLGMAVMQNASETEPNEQNEIVESDPDSKVKGDSSALLSNKGEGLNNTQASTMLGGEKNSISTSTISKPLLDDKLATQTFSNGSVASDPKMEYKPCSDSGVSSSSDEGSNSKTASLVQNEKCASVEKSSQQPEFRPQSTIGSSS